MHLCGCLTVLQDKHYFTIVGKVCLILTYKNKYLASFIIMVTKSLSSVCLGELSHVRVKTKDMRHNQDRLELPNTDFCLEQHLNV